MVGQALPDEPLLQRPRLRVGAVDDGDVTPRDALAAQFADEVADLSGFVLFVEGLDDFRRLAVVALGPKHLFRAVGNLGNYGVGRSQDVSGRPVVAFQVDDPGGGELALEIKDVADVGPAPGVNALVVVANDADIASVRGQLPDEFVLRAVGVLVFVDQDEAETVLVEGAQLGELAKQSHTEGDHVAKVHPVGAIEQPLVAVVDLRDGFIEVALGPFGIDVGIRQFVLGA